MLHSERVCKADIKVFNALNNMKAFGTKFTMIFLLNRVKINSLRSCTLVKVIAL